MEYNYESYMENIPSNVEISGDRYTYNGVNVPRVTEILSAMWYSEGLMHWANSLGYKKQSYTKVRDEAANTGTIAHDSIEYFLKTGKDPDIQNAKSLNAYCAFKEWYSMLQKNGHTTEVLGMEEKLTCPWFGGTYDLLLNIDDKLCLIDFKTSNHISEKYYMQIAAYKYMLALKNITPVYAIILQLDKNAPVYYEYMIDFSNQDHSTYMQYALQSFFLICSAYYNRLYLENNIGMMR